MILPPLRSLVPYEANATFQFVYMKMANTRALAFGFISGFDQRMSEPWIPLLWFFRIKAKVHGHLLMIPLC